MKDEIEKRDPSKIKDGEIDYEFEEELAEYAAKESLDESDLFINGEKFFIGE